MAQAKERIRGLNDKLRQTFRGGRVVQTRGMAMLAPELLARIYERVRTFDSFSPDNDPHGEHDFGSFDIENQRVMWKIDYYDREMQGGSNDPADPAQTTRVLTLMLAEEY